MHFHVFAFLHSNIMITNEHYVHDITAPFRNDNRLIKKLVSDIETPFYHRSDRQGDN